MNTNDEPSRLTNDFMTGVLSGYLMGSEDGYQHAQEDMAKHWANVAHIVHANARAEPLTLRERKRKARQIAAAARHQAEAAPWPDEDTT